jgi:hypothetical protein
LQTEKFFWFILETFLLFLFKGFWNRTSKKIIPKTFSCTYVNWSEEGTRWNRQLRKQILARKSSIPSSAFATRRRTMYMQTSGKREKLIFNDEYFHVSIIEINGNYAMKVKSEVGLTLIDTSMINFRLHRCVASRVFFWCSLSGFLFAFISIRW